MHCDKLAYVNKLLSRSIFCQSFPETRAFCRIECLRIGVKVGGLGAEAPITFSAPPGFFSPPELPPPLSPSQCFVYYNLYNVSPCLF